MRGEVRRALHRVLSRRVLSEHEGEQAQDDKVRRRGTSRAPKAEARVSARSRVGVSAGGGAGRWGEGRKGRREGERRGRRRRRRGRRHDAREGVAGGAAGREAGYRFLQKGGGGTGGRRDGGLSPSGARIRRDAIRDETRATSTHT